jgi:hypothetical protein
MGAQAADVMDARGINCDQVSMMVATYNIPNTAWGRAKARAIALAQYGVMLSRAQIEEAAKCLPPTRSGR